jgi:hypothetical protein
LCRGQKTQKYCSNALIIAQGFWKKQGAKKKYPEIALSVISANPCRVAEKTGRSNRRACRETGDRCVAPLQTSAAGRLAQGGERVASVLVGMALRYLANAISVSQ